VPSGGIQKSASWVYRGEVGVRWGAGVNSGRVEIGGQKRHLEEKKKNGRGLVKIMGKPLGGAGCEIAKTVRGILTSGGGWWVVLVRDFWGVVKRNDRCGGLSSGSMGQWVCGSCLTGGSLSKMGEGIKGSKVKRLLGVPRGFGVSRLGGSKMVGESKPGRDWWCKKIHRTKELSLKKEAERRDRCLS